MYLDMKHSCWRTALQGGETTVLKKKPNKQLVFAFSIEFQLINHNEYSIPGIAMLTKASSYGKLVLSLFNQKQMVNSDIAGRLL